jgi:cytoskeletal protein RodZ
MESIGAKLKRIRLEKGLSFEEAHKKTKIHVDVLKALEEDGILNLSPIYIKGFLRIYCEFLGLNPKEFLSNYQEAPSSKVSFSERKEDSTLSYFKTPAIKLNTFKPRIKIKFVIIFLVIIGFVFLIIGLAKFMKTKRPVRSMVNKRPLIVLRSKTEPAKKIKPGVVIVPKLSESVAKAKNPVEATNQKNINSEIRLGMHVKEDSWVELKLDGKTVLKAVLKKGKFENWTAKEKIELSVGNAQGIELEVNSKRLPPLGRRGQTLKNILITKDGLSVPR